MFYEWIQFLGLQKQCKFKLRTITRGCFNIFDAINHFSLSTNTGGLPGFAAPFDSADIQLHCSSYGAICSWDITHGAAGVSQVWRNSQRWSHLSPTPSGASAFCSQIQRSLSILTLFASLCVHNSYLDSLCVLLINHLSAESSRSCITALSDGGDAAYFACKIPSRRMLIEWQWSKFGVAMQLQGWY